MESPKDDKQNLKEDDSSGEPIKSYWFVTQLEFIKYWQTRPLFYLTSPIKLALAIFLCFNWNLPQIFHRNT